MNYEEEFVSYLSKIWDGGFSHSYKITTNQVWNSWRAKNGGRADSWFCNSLKQACENYSWSTNNEVRSFDEISKDLINAVKINDNKSARELCLEVFKWGGVARTEDDRSKIWINNRALAGTLCSDLLFANNILKYGTYEDLNVFNTDNFLMNSSMTKVYAASDEENNIVIYDGRVGVALCLIVKNFLLKHKIGSVPEELAFLWGGSQNNTKGTKDKRDPSCDLYKFRRLFGGNKDKIHALQVMKLIKVSRAVVENRNDKSLTAGNLEKALFMIGYSLSSEVENLKKDSIEYSCVDSTIRIHNSETFDALELIAELKQRGVNAIVQGQQAVALDSHTKPQSLDYWLRARSKNKDTKLATNEVIDQLVNTDLFIEDEVHCADSGRKCKGVKIRN